MKCLSSFAGFLPAFILLLSVETGQAGSATWNSSPATNDWNTDANWTPNTGYPNGSGQTATFAFSNATGVSISAFVQIGNITFTAAATSPYAVTTSPTVTLQFLGTGITNNSGIAQNFLTAVDGAGNGSSIEFANGTAGSMTTFTNSGTSVLGGSGGFTRFQNNSSAASGAFINNGGSGSSAGGGSTSFTDSSTAGNGTFTNNAGTVSNAVGGSVQFFITASAGSGLFTNNGGAFLSTNGFTRFNDSSTAAGATLIGNGGSVAGGSIKFAGNSSGGTSRVEVFGNGNLDISIHSFGSVAIGSLEGNGNVFLGGINLAVGSNNLSTTFSGVMQGSGGSLTKSGTGTLTLSGANTYTGGTTVNAGVLLANNTGSGTGSGAVTVNNSGTLGGTGTIGGAITVNSGGALLGGKGTTPSGALTLTNSPTLNSGSIIKLVLGASGAHSTLIRGGGGTWTLPANQAFTFINGGAQPGVYDNIITGLAADPGTEASWTITNPGFVGTFTYDGTGNIDLTLTAVHPQVAGAVSRKVHMAAGAFDVNAPLNGTINIECRTGGVTGDYQLVISFTNNVIVNGNPQAGVTSGQGIVGTNGSSNGGAVSVSGSTVTVPLTNVTNAQTIAVTVFGVNDGTNSGDVTIPMSVLIGDTTGEGLVNSADVSQTKSRSGQAINSTNFRSDVTVDGILNSSDVSSVKSRSGTALP